MGMFNSIVADVTCGTTGEILKDTEIQIKWQCRDYLGLTTYRIGDTLEHMEAEYDNTWVKTEFICDACSTKKKGWKGMMYIPTEGQVWHPVFVEVRDGRICRVLNEREFAETGVTDFVTYW